MEHLSTETKIKGHAKRLRAAETEKPPGGADCAEKQRKEN